MADFKGTHITDIDGNYYVSATAPIAPDQGDRWFNTTNGTLNYYNGTLWLSEAYTSTSTTTTTTSTSTTTTSSSTSSSTSTSTTTTSTSTTL